MSGLFAPIVYQLGLGVFGGFIVGYAIKKITKLIAILAGILLLILLYLGSSGIIVIHYNKLAEAIKNAIGASGQFSDWFTPIISHLPFAGSFIVGLLLGLKIG